MSFVLPAFEKGTRRLSSAFVDKRKSMETAQFKQWEPRDGSERSRDALPFFLLHKFLKCLPPLYRMGERNHRDVSLTKHEFLLKNWPQDLPSKKILHLSDLHFSLDPSTAERICSFLTELDEHYDLVVLTGDFMESCFPNPAPAIKGVETILPCLKTPALAILGNHDRIEIVDALESDRLRFLVNESIELPISPKHHLRVTGIDDPYTFLSEDQSLADIVPRPPQNSINLLLSHSPEVAEEADAMGFNLLLAGHTHGGQICLGNNRPIYRMKKISSKHFSGAWREGDLQGLTLRGTGSCHLPIRFFCPPEIALIELHG